MNLPILEGVDHPDVCEEHAVFAEWFEDGNAETGPQEPYLMCPACWDEHEHPLMYCDQCHKEERVERFTTAMAHFDPTSVAHLECGHIII